MRPSPISAGVWRLPMCQARRACQHAPARRSTSTSGSAAASTATSRAVLEQEGVAVLERHRLGQVDERAPAPPAVVSRLPPQEPLAVVEHDAVDGPGRVAA